MKELLVHILEKQYGLQNCRLQALAGYVSKNYKVETSEGRLLLKIYKNDPEILDDVLGENQLLHEIADHAYPKPIPNLSGDDLTILEKEGIVLRMLSFLEGEFLAECTHSESLIASFGSFLGLMDQKMSSIQVQAIKARRLSWDLEHLFICTKWVHHVNNAEARKIINYYINQWQTFVVPQITSLRHSLIHNDANDWNVLINNDRVSGIIDFGDAVYSCTIFNLAVAATYLALGKEDPVQSTATLLQSYHEVFPLREEEIDLLYYLIAGRICMSLLHSAESASKEKATDYILVSENQMLRLIKKWITISPIGARNAWRTACGFSIRKKTTEKLKRHRTRHIPSVLSTSYQKPFHMVKAAFQYMYDADGNAILDAYNNIRHVGHCHPKVVEAGQRALATLNTNTRYHYDQLAQYSEHLLSYFPDEMDQVFFVNSGSAANDLALRLARNFTGKKDIMVLEHGYHGNTSSGIDISHYKYGGKGGGGRSSHVIQCDLPDRYRGKYRSEDAGLLYAKDLEHQIVNQGQELAAFIAEPIVGCGGQVPLSEHYLAKAYEAVRARGGLCISDEVQVGFGRLGKWFWGYEMMDAIPDIIVLGKPIGNGHPMAAVITKKAIADAFDNGMEFFSSFGGNPVSCAIGKSVLEVIEEEELQKNAQDTGAYLQKNLTEMMDHFEVIGDIRGAGLFLGIDIVLNKGSRSPDGILAQKIVNSLREQHILTSLDGPGNNVIKVKPPLCFSKSDSDHLLNGLELTLGQYF